MSAIFNDRVILGHKEWERYFLLRKPQAMNSVSINGIPSVANADVEDCHVRSSLFTDLLFSLDSLGKVKGGPLIQTLR